MVIGHRIFHICCRGFYYYFYTYTSLWRRFIKLLRDFDREVKSLDIYHEWNMHWTCINTVHLYAGSRKFFQLSKSPLASNRGLFYVWYRVYALFCCWQGSANKFNEHWWQIRLNFGVCCQRFDIFCYYFNIISVGNYCFYIWFGRKLKTILVIPDWYFRWNSCTVVSRRLE